MPYLHFHDVAVTKGGKPAMSMPRKFSTLVGLGVLMVILMTYLLSFSNRSGSAHEKGLKLMHKQLHKPLSPSSVQTADHRGPPTTPTQHSVLAEHVKKKCKELRLGKPGASVNPERYDHILVDDRYKMLYCYIPKVACTNWRRLMLVMSGKVKVENVLDIAAADVHGRYKRLLPRLSNYSHREIQYRLDNYFKFMFVREPFERLLSAWKNKFQNSANTYFRKQFGQSILRRFRESDEIKDRAVVRFEEFLQYIVDPLRTESLNEHWATYQRLCLPCSMQYDFVGRYENMEPDAQHVLQAVHADHVVRFPQRSATYKHNQTSSYLASFYKNISAPLLRRVYRIYRKDFVLFDLTLPSELQWVFR